MSFRVKAKCIQSPCKGDMICGSPWSQSCVSALSRPITTHVFLLLLLFVERSQLIPTSKLWSWLLLLPGVTSPYTSPWQPHKCHPLNETNTDHSTYTCNSLPPFLIL